MHGRVLGAVVAAMFLSCAGPTGPEGPAGTTGATGATGPAGSNGTDGATSLIRVTAEAAGANCTYGGQRVDTGLDDGSGNGTANDGTLQTGEVRATAYICDGAAGTSPLVTVSSEAPGSNCTRGGQKFQTGLDNGDGGGTANDGTLQAGEVDATAYVCNGLDGSDGTNGTDGYSTLFTVTNEPAGSNCLAGGRKLESGLDNGDGGGTARDGVLQPGEVDQTDYLCSCGRLSTTLSAAVSVSVPYPNGTIYNDDNTRAYSNPTGNCGGTTPCDITGWYGFDTTSIPDSAVIVSMTLRAYMTTLVGAPTLQVYSSTGNNWTRAAATPASLPRTTAVSAVFSPTSGVNSFVPFSIDVGAQDWSPDLVDNWISLGLDNTNLAYTYSYFAGSDTANRATLQIDYLYCPN